MKKEKKKILILVLLALSVLCLTGCNKQIIDLHYDYDKVVCNYDGNEFELKIDKWNDYEGEQLQVKSNGKTYLVSANKCYMVGE